MSLGEYLGLGENESQHVREAFVKGHVNPEERVDLEQDARGADLYEMYARVLREQEERERDQENALVEAERTYIAYAEAMAESREQLKILKEFLSAFKGDLGAVSAHVERLQDKSQDIEKKLEEKVDASRKLAPLVRAIVVPPKLVTFVLKWDLDDVTRDKWIDAANELSEHMAAVRSGPLVESRRALNETLEVLRQVACDKIMVYFVQKLEPMTTSIGVDINAAQDKVFRPSKALFDFVRRHAPVFSHDFEKMYVNTVRWYYETTFRRYVRSLEKTRVRDLSSVHVIGDAAKGILERAGDAALGATSASSAYSHIFGGGDEGKAVDLSKTTGPGGAYDCTQISKVPVLNAAEIASSVRLESERLFHSILLAFTHVARVEWEFILDMFGATPAVPEVDDAHSVAGLTDLQGDDSESTIGDAALPPKDERKWVRRCEELWKFAMEPAAEHSRNMASQFVDDKTSGTVSLVAMARLLDRVIASLTAPDSFVPRQLLKELMGLRMSVWPVIQRSMDAHAQSVAAIRTRKERSFWGFGEGHVDADTVRTVVRQYTDLFCSLVVLTDGDDKSPVFMSVQRVRAQVESLIEWFDSGRLAAEMYGALSRGLGHVAIASHPVSQKEAARYNERQRLARLG